MMCKNCGMENAMPNDIECWHCGEPLSAEAPRSLNRGFCHERTKHCQREAALAEHWEKENEPRPWLNYGNGILQDLFISPDPRFPSARLWSRCHHKITDAERMVAATVIQWLGTNCGMAFIGEAFRKCGYRLVRDESPPIADQRKPE